MYDFASEVLKPNTKVENWDLSVVPDLSTPESSFNLHNYINVSNQVPTESPSVNFGFPMPQSAGFGSEAGIKQEPTAVIESHTVTSRSTSGYDFGGLPEIKINSAVFRGDQREISCKSEEKKAKKKVPVKASDEYRRRRERNNIAVQKSRAKAKQRSKETEKRIRDLMSEDEELRKRVELLSTELSVIKNLLSKIGMSPETAARGME